MADTPRYETMVRAYSTTDTHQFDRERAELEAQGWTVERIDSRESKPGCGLPLIGALMYRPTGTLVVTYRKRVE